MRDIVTSKPNSTYKQPEPFADQDWKKGYIKNWTRVVKDQREVKITYHKPKVIQRGDLDSPEFHNDNQELKIINARKRAKGISTRKHTLVSFH